MTLRSPVRFVLIAATSLSALALALAAGCGSSDDSGLTGATPDGGGSSSGDTGTSTTDSGNNNNGDAGGSSSGDSGNTNDSGNPGNADGGNEGGSPGGSTSTLSCGSATCSIPAQSCCITNPPGPNNFAFACVTGGCAVDAGPGGGGDPPTALKCSGQANCGPGTVCCVSTGNNTTTSECKASCGGGGGGGGDTAQLCDPAAPAASNGCPQNAPCSTNNIGDWGLPNTFGTCGGQGN